MKAKETVARLDLLCILLGADLSIEELEKRTKDSERMDQIRPFLKTARETLEGDMHDVIEKINGVHKDMRHAVEELKGVTKDVRHVVEELKDLSDDIRRVMRELVQLNQCMNFVPICEELKKTRRNRRLVNKELNVTEREMILAVNLCAAESRSRSTGSLGLAKPRSKATGCRDDFRRRECRLNAMRKALEEASVVAPRIRYVAVWTELDELWHKLMAHEVAKSFAKKKRGCVTKVSDQAGCATTVSDAEVDTMNTFDAKVDKLDAWISAL
jgi:archaellum component FlaC